jgi:hypothetical protein
MAGVSARVLNEYLFLADHPFEPTLDPGPPPFDFQDRDAYLTDELDVFRVRELMRYFLAVGPFGDAVQTVRQRLDALHGGFRATAVPPILVYGGNGAGRTSMSRVVAHLLRERCAAPPTLNPVDVIGEHLGKILLAVAEHVEIHVGQHAPGRVALLQPLARINQENPDEFALVRLLGNDALRQVMRGTPCLIEVIEPITLVRWEWVGRLSRLLRPLNIVLLFLTDNDNVVTLFESLLPDGLSVRLSELDVQDLLDLIEARMTTFRHGALPPGRPRVFPFDAAVVRKAYADKGEWRMKPLLRLLRTAVSRKVAALGRHADGLVAGAPLPLIGEAEATVSWEDMTAAYREALGGPGR